jgi:hypothetical protein
MKDNKYFIYFHINPSNEEIYYVGQGTHQNQIEFEKEFKRAFEFKKSRSDFWKNVYNKYGVIVKIVERNICFDKIDELEIFHIKTIGRRDLGFGTLINLTDGGDGNKNMSNESKEKIRKALTGRKHGPMSESHRIKISTSKKGIPGQPLTDEAKKKVSESLKGNKRTLGYKHTDETKDKISEKHKGVNNFFYGKKHSEETKLKMRGKRNKPLDK